MQWNLVWSESLDLRYLHLNHPVCLTLCHDHCLLHNSHHQASSSAPGTSRTSFSGCQSPGPGVAPYPTHQPDVDEHGGSFRNLLATHQFDQPCGRPQLLPHLLLAILPRFLHPLPHHGRLLVVLQPVPLRTLQRHLQTPLPRYLPQSPFHLRPKVQRHEQPSGDEPCS